MFQSKTLNNSTVISAAAHIALTATEVSALRHMNYESRASVCESRLSLTAHLRRIEIAADVYRALY